MISRCPPYEIDLASSRTGCQLRHSSFRIVQTANIFTDRRYSRGYAINSKNNSLTFVKIEDNPIYIPKKKETENQYY